MNIKETKLYSLIESIVKTPKLFETVNGHDAEIDKYKLDTTFKYLLITNNNNKIIGFFQVKEFTKIVLEVHINILPEYWGTGDAEKAVYYGHQWAKDRGYKKCFTKIPANCIHALKTCTRCGYKACGYIKNGIIFNKCLVSLFFFEFEV